MNSHRPCSSAGAWKIFAVLGAVGLAGSAFGYTTDHRRFAFSWLFAFETCLAIALGAIFFVLAMSLRTTFADKFAADSATADVAARYLLWFIPAMALQFGVVAMAAALRGAGNFRPGMVVQSSTVVVNMVLAPFLIFGWGTGHPMGAAGAAVATLIAVVVGTVWLALYFLPDDSFLRFVAADARPQYGLWRRLLKIGSDHQALATEPAVRVAHAVALGPEAL